MDVPIPGAINVPLKELGQRMDEVDRESIVYVFCGSGVRSMIGASLLWHSGWHNLRVVLGGLSGWNSSSCPLPFD